MYVLSVRQPFASLIVHGFKQIETRRWETRYRGLLTIHASRGQDHTNVETAYLAPVKAFLRKCGHRSFKSLPRGAILGTVWLQQITPVGELIDAETHEPMLPANELLVGNYAYHNFAWRLVQPRVFANPFPCYPQGVFWKASQGVEMACTSLGDTIAAEVRAGA
jgi:activating signal cointegrator 1